MAEIKIKVSDKLIDEATKKELKALRGQVARLRHKNMKLELQVTQNEDSVDRAKSIIESVRSAGGFREDED